MPDSHEPNQNLLAAQEAPPSQRILLYVEDHPANLALVEKLIARRGDLKLVSAVNGHLGLQLARSHLPDVILLDINLPDISGISVLGILREDPETAHIPVIALSSNAHPRQIEKGIEAGFLRYLIKPFKLDELMDALDFALHSAAKNRQTKQD